MAQTSESPKMYLIMDRQEEKHDQPWPSYHIETPKRLDVIYEMLQNTGLYTDSRIEHLERREASEEEIQMVHTKRYVNDVKATESMTPEQQEQFSSKYEDIYANNATWKRAKLAAGSAIDLAKAVVSSKKPGIAFIRPPGHHAMPDEGCGFCIFNNVAIAAKSVVKNNLAKRVMIVDYDVHAGNGTQECIEGSEGIQLISIHRYENGTFWPNMPQTGIYHNYKNTLNIPLNTISLNDADYFALFTQIILPSIHSFRPDLILISSGFDAALGDPEGYMNVTPRGFATMVRMMMGTGVPVAAILEGGYFLESLAADSELVIRAMLGERIAKVLMQNEKLARSIVETISRIQDRYQDMSGGFFRKVQELRETVLGPQKMEVPENPTDYKGERTVCAPYETRGIYTPFSEEKVNGFKKQLVDILKEYKEREDEVIDWSEFIEVDNRKPANFLGLKDNGKLVHGNGASVKLFVELVFVAPVEPLFTMMPITDADFSLITLNVSLKNVNQLPMFSNLPIFQQ